MENQDEKRVKEKTFMITPYRKDRMTCSAPSMAIWSKSYASALVEARKISRLSDFDNWIFI
ncbi:MAG: hypothetical protein WC720_05020 [Candidatus Shapirobacteria bacterium]|jgi:hypothetical protein